MKIGIIADDLTGANATGVGLAKAGFISATHCFWWERCLQIVVLLPLVSIRIVDMSHSIAK